MHGNTLLIIGLVALAVFVIVIAQRRTSRQKRELAIRESACEQAVNAKANAKIALDALPTDTEMSKAFHMAAAKIPEGLIATDRTLCDELRAKASELRSHYTKIAHDCDTLEEMTYETSSYLTIADMYDDVRVSASHIASDFKVLATTLQSACYAYSPEGQTVVLDSIAAELALLDKRTRSDRYLTQFRFGIGKLRTKVEDIRTLRGTPNWQRQSHDQLTILKKEVSDLFLQIASAESIEQRRHKAGPRNNGRATSESAPVIKRPSSQSPPKRKRSSGGGFGSNFDSGYDGGSTDSSCGSD